MFKLLSNLAQNIEPYVPGEQPQGKKYIKLNSNENPYPPSPKTLDAIKKAVNEDMSLYPDPQYLAAKQAIADYYGVTKDNVFCGNGSDEVLGFSFLAFFNPGNPILFPDITYLFYEVYANLFKIDFVRIPLNDDFTIHVEKFFIPNGGIIIANPNAPTGLTLEVCEIEKIIANNPRSVVIVDEAYVDFGGESCIKLVPKYSNLLVIQTFSKSRGLAGLRFGFAIANKELIDGLERIKYSFNSYNVDRLAQAAVESSLEDSEYFNETIEAIIQTRDYTSKKLTELGFKVIPSSSNFVFASHSVVNAKDLYLILKERKILVRYFDRDRINNYLRITIGTKEDMDTFLKETESILETFSKGA